MTMGENAKMIRRTQFVDPDVTVAELLRQWQHMNRQFVIAKLEADHAALTALFLTQGYADKILTRTDFNYITNCLIEHRQAICHNGE